MGQIRNVYKILVGKPDGKRPLRTARHMWQDNSEMDRREITFRRVDLIRLAQDRNW
jgi:hypothetical protein